MPATTPYIHPSTWRDDPQKTALDKRLAALFWALMFILAGIIWAIPREHVPDGTWLVGIGAILLSLNAVRLTHGITVHALPTLLGILSLVAGLAAWVGMELPLVALTMLAIGASIIVELRTRTE